MENEIWKPVVGYEGLYEISSFGKVKSLEKKWKSHLTQIHTRKEKIVKQQKNKKGYSVITLCADYKKKTLLVHRIVATAFILNKSKKETVNHINGDKSDNKVENLEWCTNLENIRHAFKIGLFENRKLFQQRNEKGRWVKSL